MTRSLGQLVQMAAGFNGHFNLELKLLPDWLFNSSMKCLRNPSSPVVQISMPQPQSQGRRKSRGSHTVRVSFDATHFLGRCSMAYPVYSLMHRPDA
jgi:hypothetical protein